MILIKDADLILTFNRNFDIVKGDILIKGNRILDVNRNIVIKDDNIKIINAKGKIVMPGFVQPHIHLCQSIFKNLAEDLPLLSWLEGKIFPLEAAHSYESLKISAYLGIYELLNSGTTTIMSMETVNHTDAVFEVIKETGIRAITGKCMVDKGNSPLKEDTDKSIKESITLLEKWHNSENGRIKYAFAPRFVPTCSEKLLKEVVKLSKKYNVLIHTHASENKDEIKLVKKQTGMDNIVYFDKIGLTGDNLVLAHGIWVNDEEFEILKKTKTSVVHCPSSNLKLASGIADIKNYFKLGIKLGLSSDGTPCSNNLDQFLQMRLAGYLQKVKYYDASAIKSRDIVYMATKGSAKVLKLDKEIASIEKDYLADLIILNPETIESLNSKKDIYSSIVYSFSKQQVDTVIVDGKIVKENGKMLYLNEKLLLQEANKQLKNLLDRAIKYGYRS